MDGFSSHENVLVIGSTNRLEMIDQSLLRAGRFDLKIKIPLPNEEDRFDILKYHLSSKRYNFTDAYLRNRCSLL
jgi:SpoVK/Ycf46/Vps4 family AAA+-type ATPase